MKNQTVSRSESKTLYDLFKLEPEVEDSRREVFLETLKLCPLLSKLKPLYGGVLPKFTRMVIALFLCGSLIHAPVFAADNVLSQNYVAPPAEMTLATAQAQPATPAPTPTVSAADSFVLAGPLSTATVNQTVGRSLYVSTTGSDTATGAEGAAFKTLAYAVSQLKAGDTLNIAEGTYQQPGGGAVFTTSGTANAYITVQGVGNVVIEGVGTTTISGYTVASNYNPAFDTKGQDYIRFNNLTVNNLRDAVEVSPGSSYIEIDGLRSDRNHFAVKINGGDHVTVKNVVATNSRNGFRLENTAGIVPTDILFENINVSGSKDVYTGFETKYRNGDGFITEAGNRITIRNVVSHDNWDGGFDLKATNVLLEHVETYGNKNNFKIWGSAIVVKDSLVHDAKILVGDPVAGEGWGVNNRGGQITFINTTFANNENADIRTDNQIGNPTTILENCIIVRNIAAGKLYENTYGGLTADNNNIWYDATKAAGFTVGSSSIFSDPKLVSLSNKDFHLQAGSPAINFGSNAYSITTLDYDGKTRVVDGIIDLGAYEYQGLPPDTTAPVINTVVAATITVSGATINWVTNEASDSQVEYRLMGSTVWSATSIDASMMTNHSMVLTGLSASTMYEYQVKSKDQAGNLAIAAATGFSFATLTPPDTTAPVLSAVASTIVSTSGATISWVTNEVSDSQVQYRAQGSTTWLNTTLNAAFVINHSVVLSGLNAGTVYEYQVKSKDQAGNLATQAAVSSFTTAIPVVACTTAMCGVTNNQTVSGVVKIQPNLQLNPDIKKVAYYLNGTLVSREYTSPFSINTGAGLDTTKMADGTYTLNGAYTTTVGDQNFSITFIVKNAVSLEATTCTTAMCGVVGGQTLSGTVVIQPNLQLNPDIRKVAYYLNGTLYTREYSSPFTMGGAAGFDTKKLANGTYVITGAYTTAAGDVPFTISFTVKN